MKRMVKATSQANHKAATPFQAASTHSIKGSLKPTSPNKKTACHNTKQFYFPPHPCPTPPIC